MVLLAKNFTSAAAPQVLIEISTTATRDTNMDMTITETAGDLLHPTGVGITMIEMIHGLIGTTAAAAAAAAGIAVEAGAGAVVGAVRLQKRDLQVEAFLVKRS